MHTKDDRRTAALLAVYLGVPAAGIITRELLGATLSIPLILFLSFVLTLPAVRRRTGGGRGWNIAHAVIFGGGGVLLIISIVITPFGSYEAWFSSFLLGSTKETSVVSNLFTTVTIYFAAILLPGGLSVGFSTSIGSLVLFLLFLATVITREAALAALFAFGIVGLIVFRTIRVHGKSIRWRHLFRWLLPIGAAAVGVAILLAGTPTDGGRAFVDNGLSPALRQAVLTLDPSFPLVYDSARAGRDFREKRLGGVPALTTKPIFAVYGRPGQTLYLRMSVLDDYTGKSWKISRTVLHDGLSFRSPTHATRNDPPRVRVTVLANNIDLVPMTLDTVAFYSRGLRSEIVEGNYDTGFRLESPIEENRTVTLLRVDEKSPQLQPELRQAYLEIPNNLPRQVRDLARTIAGTATSPEQILRRIQSYLDQNYTYTLTPSQPRTFNDFVSSFLFSSGGGYCVQFASAFVILARLNGIPARYATGFLANIPVNEHQVTVTGLTSHAWPEVWLDQKGWTTWEATPALNPASYHRTTDGAWVYDYRLDDNHNTARQLAGILGVQVQSSSAPPTVVPSAEGHTFRWWPIAVSGLVLLVLAGAFLLRRRRRRGMARRELRFYRKVGRLARTAQKRLGVPNPGEIGWVAWNERAGKRLNGAGHPIAEVTQIVIHHLYADRPLPEHAVSAARLAERTIRRRNN